MTLETDKLPDNRSQGDWKTRYSLIAWWQIIFELVLALLSLTVALIFLFEPIIFTKNNAVEQFPNVYRSTLTGICIYENYRKWIGLFISGWIGGVLFVLKWLYHSVAKGIWNQDRFIWRIVVPLNSAIVALFTGFFFASGVIPFLKNEPFEDTLTLLSFGFLFGYFSDSILAAMHNFAKNIFGTLGNIA